MPRFYVINIFCLICLVTWPDFIRAQSLSVPVYSKFEQTFTSTKAYENPLYEVTKFVVHFTSPTGKKKNINGFWDGGTTWKVRFAPDEKGEWTYLTETTEVANTGLHKQEGKFTCIGNKSKLSIYAKGPIMHPKGAYYLTYTDGTPFFWTACTAWNGALKSTDDEWKRYLQHRVANNYNVIHFVTTQWRGGDKNINGQVAFEGSGRIKLNIDFFKHLDKKFDEINNYGLVAAPVLLWALPSVRGRELSPGYYLPDQEAIKLARYMVARYGGHQVIWTLGGDGKYDGEFEQRWKTIGRGVFGEEHPGLVTTHPQGSSWIGELYAQENWLDIIGYQSSHNNGQRVVDWINKGPMSQKWDKLPARPLINMEPNYEEISFKITDKDVRNASYWSIFATPPAGITYGANGIWPWLREGEDILNHESAKGTHTWEQSMKFPGSLQIGYLHKFISSFEWWKLRPAPELLEEQPGDKTFNHFVSVVKTPDSKTILAYVPVQSTLKLANPLQGKYEVRWFNPITNTYQKGKATITNNVMEVTSPSPQDWVLVLKSK